MQGASIHHGRKGAKEGRGSMVERLRLITEEVQRCRERIEQDRIRREQRR